MMIKMINPPPLASLCFMSLVTSLSLLSEPQELFAEDLGDDPVKIMRAVQDRETGDRSKSRLTMTIINAQGQKRERSVQSFSMKFGEGKEEVTKQIMYFESPEDIRGTGLLSFDYEDGDRDDDQWLYLPSLRKSTRISSGERSGSFMGTDLSYADMTQSDPSHYTYKMIKTSMSVKLNGQPEDCWLIKSTPKTQKTIDETGYTMSYIWVSKSKLMPLQIRAQIRKGKKTKLIKFSDVKKVDGFWTAHTIIARTSRNKKTESTTVLQFSEMSYNHPDITVNYFDQSRLERGF
jgi:outer membrane lipoprotein-sorting protein